MSDPLTALLTAIGVILVLVLLSQRKVTIIYPPNVGLLYRNGNFVRELGPGRHVVFDPLNQTRIAQVSRAQLPTQLADLAVMTKDQFSFRLGLSPVLEIVDARAFIESQDAVEPTQMTQFMPVANSHAALQPLAASAALEVTAAYTLREIFASPQLIVDALQASLDSAVPGARVSRVLLTSMTLPPETRKMFTEVERSKMQGEAALERSRAEQASLRALANAARLIKDNPALANLRFLQMVEHAPGPKTIVIGRDSGALSGDVAAIG